MLTTTNYKFKKPELTDSPPDITVMNGNWDIIDTNLKKLNDDKAPKDVATTSKDGLMSKTDKSKLDGIAQGANAYTHPSKHPASIITEDATHRFLTDAERKLIQAWEKFKASGGEIGGRVSSEVFLTLLSNSQQYGMYNRGGHLAFPRYNSNGDFVDIPFEIQPNGDFYCNGYSKNTNGYNKLPNGMIEQWGVVNITGQAANAWCTGWSIQYPKLFPNAIVSLDIQILVDGNSHDADLRVMPYLTENTNTFQYHCKVGANGTLKFKWRALGY